jgi:hypothetical protein
VRRSEGQWVEILRRFESSGLGSRSFCRREGLSSSSLQRWRSRLGSKAKFVELIPPPTSASEDRTEWSVEFVLPNGVSIRMRG